MVATGIFVKLQSQDGSESECPETKLQIITSSSEFEKVTVQKSIAELWMVISNPMIKYHLPQTRLDQISDHKHDKSLYGKLSTKQLAQAVNQNTKFMITKTGRLLFFLSVISEGTGRERS